MGRALFTLAAGLSSVLCAAVVLLWVQRGVVRHHVGYDRAGQRTWSAWSDSAVIKTLSASPWPAGDGLTVSRSWPAQPGPEPILFVDPPVYYEERFTVGLSWGTGHTLLNEDGSVMLVHPGTEPEGPLSAPVNWWCLDVPYTTAGVATGALPVVWVLLTSVRLATRMRRRARRLCLRCGYDLRASGGRCSECGAPTPDSASSAPEACPTADARSVGVTGAPDTAARMLWR